MTGWCQHHGVGVDQSKNTSFAIGTPVQIIDPVTRAELIGQIRNEIPSMPVLIAVDTYAACGEFKDENRGGGLGVYSGAWTAAGRDRETVCIIERWHIGGED